MIEIIEGLPDNVVAVAAKGQVSRRDYSEVLVPAVEDAFRHHNKVRCYYELGREFSGMDAGAVWEDFKIGVEHIAQWERVAVVTDASGSAWPLMLSAFSFPVMFESTPPQKPQMPGVGSRAIERETLWAAVVQFSVRKGIDAGSLDLNLQSLSRERADFLADAIATSGLREDVHENLCAGEG